MSVKQTSRETYILEVEQGQNNFTGKDNKLNFKN